MNLGQVLLPPVCSCIARLLTMLIYYALFAILPTLGAYEILTVLLSVPRFIQHIQAVAGRVNAQRAVAHRLNSSALMQTI